MRIYFVIVGLIATVAVASVPQDSVRVQKEYEILFEGKYYSPKPLKNATVMFLDIIKNKRYLTKEQWSKVHHKMLTRPTADSYYDTPDGHFKIHYNSWEVDTHYVHRCGEFFERAWQVEVDSLGFLPPVSDGTLGGDSRLDVYITDFPYAIYGMTVPDEGGYGPAPWNDVSVYIEVNTSYDGFPPNDDPEGSNWGAFKVTCAHEFFHAVQMAYDYNEEVWMLEIASVWMEDIVYDYVNDYYNYQYDFFENPWKSIMTYDGIHEYSSAHWFHYLSENYSAEVIKAIFNKMIYADGMEAISEGLDSLGLSLNREFTEFVAWDYLTGSRADSFHFQEAANYPEIYVESAYSSLPITFSPVYAHRPGSYASNYVAFSGGIADAIHIELSGDPGTEWHYAVIIPGEHAQILLPDDSTGNFRVDGRPFAVVVFPAGAFSASYSYNYTLTVAETTLGFVARAGGEFFLCHGDSVRIGGEPTASGGTPPYQYFWTPSAGLSDSTSANPLAFPDSTTLYHLTVVDADGDTARDSVLVRVDTPFEVVVGPETLEVSAGSETTLGVEMFGGTPPYECQWNPPELFEEPDLPIQRLQVDTTVTIWVEVLDSFGCMAADTVVLYVVDNVYEDIMPNNISIVAYPNPFNRAVNIKLPHSGRLIISTIDGKVVYSNMVKPGVFVWKPDKNVPAGLYIVNFDNLTAGVLYVP